LSCASALATAFVSSSQVIAFSPWGTSQIANGQSHYKGRSLRVVPSKATGDAGRPLLAAKHGL
jgi:hypothetical protein